MGELKHDGLAIPGRVVLAHEPPFALGGLRIHPGTRQVERGDNRETVEPRVMQTLVALARADGAIVTRDELIERCWDGRIVGDDAINRVMSRIRHIAAGIGGGGFAVETIARVGYRLTAADAAGQDHGPAEPTRRRLVTRRTALVAGGAAAVIGTAGYYAALRAPGAGAPTAEAQSLYFLAIGLHGSREPANNRQAIAYLREAVRLSPRYGQAWGMLALAYRSAIEEEPPERVRGFEERMQEAVRQAKLFDPGNSDAAAAVLQIGPTFGKWQAMERQYRAAIDRLPTHSAAQYMLGSVLMDCGRWRDAIASLSAARRREKFAPLLAYKLTLSLWGAGELTAADREIDDALRRWPQHGAIWQTKAKLLALTGRADAALAFIDDPVGRPIDPGEHLYAHRRLYFTALIDRTPALVDRAIDAERDRSRKEPLNRLNGALALTTLGAIDLALDMVEGVCLGRGEWADGLKGQVPSSTHPLFQPHARPLWSEPRFKRLLETIGLERYWSATRSRPAYLPR